jgi:hypothetical protein
MTPDSVTLQGHLEGKVGALKAQICTWVDAHSEKHDLEAKEIARRLDILNGEADRLRQMQATYLPRELYDTQCSEFRREIDELRLFRANITGQIVAYSAAIGLALSVITFILSKYF